MDEDDDHSPRGEVIGISSMNDNGTGTPALSVGRAHACVVRYEEDVAIAGGVSPRAYCWGSNSHGQLGFAVERGTKTAMPTQFPSAWTVPCKLDGVFAGVATDVTSKLRVQQIATGGNHTCAVVRIQELSSVAAIALKASCIDDDAHTLVWCSGANESGQGGPVGDVGGRWLREADGKLSTGFTELVAGASFTCGLRGDSVYCWGDNRKGQIGIPPDANPRRHPLKIAFSAPSADGTPGVVRRLVAGPGHACAIVGTSRTANALDQVFCWGDNTFNQAGSATTMDNPHVIRRIFFQ